MSDPLRTLEALVRDELKSIELADIKEGIEDTARLTVYLTSLAHAAHALGVQQERERCAQIAHQVGEQLQREINFTKRNTYSIAAQIYDTITEAIRRPEEGR